MAKLPKYLDASQYNISTASDMIAKAVLADPNYADMLAYTYFAKEVLKYPTPLDLKEVLKNEEGISKLASAIFSAIHQYSEKFKITQTKSSEEGGDGDSLEKN